MPVIKPISDLRNNFTSISFECHENGEPVYLTKNGKGDLVVMSIDEFEKLQGKLELYSKLSEAETLANSGDEGISHKEMMNKLRKRIDG
jgi:prevent-host-death family protein